MAFFQYGKRGDRLFRKKWEYFTGDLIVSIYSETDDVL